MSQLHQNLTSAMGKGISLTLTPCMLLLGLMSLGGCAETINESQGTAITLVPVTQTLSLDAGDKGLKGAKREIADFIQVNKALIATQGISLTWRSESGKALADFSVQQASSAGLLASQFAIAQAQDKGADISLSLTEYRVLTSVCDYPSIGKFGAGDSSCFVDNARWQSMVNPQNNLPKQQVAK
ncbi:MAG: hypothetical protein LPD71_02090 [Shewanella sp.]|nr:hypothetical protein [Shewanella sp.]MCF1430169.1 hypothetical protein [Shewanella sp.]MCF1437568.1 hypothetical protein [Shewanella sp.]MCF1456247.1 hypothetical protein [Shewanella sp.]